jgi:plastocyanin domain-containing protein
MWRRVVFSSSLLGLALLASCSKKSGGIDAPSCPTCVTVGEHGFAPSSLTLPAGPLGSKTTLTFTRTTDETCATAVVFPDLNIKQDLPLGRPTKIDVPTDTARTLGFQCGMGMYKSQVVVR